MDIFNAIHGRRSVGPKHLVAPAPDMAALAHMVDAALAAPDHGRLRPWRLLLVRDDARGALANLFVASRLHREPDAPADELERERSRATGAPATLVVCARLHRDGAVPATEQWMAIGAAIQNLLLAAHALGFGAKLLSGSKARDPLIRAGLGLDEDEEIAAFVAIGTPVRQPLPRPVCSAMTALSLWRPSCAQAGGALR